MVYGFQGTMVLEECRGRWRIVLDSELTGFLQGAGSSRRSREVEKGAWRRLSTTILKLSTVSYENPVIYEIDGVKRRRYKLYLRGKGYRLVYVVYPTLCTPYTSSWRRSGTRRHIGG